MNPKCDMCGFKDGHSNLHILHCTECNVYVHRECYGVTEVTDTEFVCFACDAVGKKFEAVEVWKVPPNVDDKCTTTATTLQNGNFNVITKTVKQRTRPVECALCSVKDGIHCMHPLMDNHGQVGRRLYQQGGNGREELVWAHSLCAYFIASPALSMTYGCTSDGAYEPKADDASDDSMDEEELDEYLDGDKRPANPELVDTSRFDKTYGAEAIHYFRYYLRPPGGWVGEDEGNSKLSPYFQSIVQRQEYLKCSICGKSDKREDFVGQYMNLRIPVQCKANERDERNELKKKHGDKETCFQAFHVGCAKWGGSNPHNLRRVYFYPGDGNTEVVDCLYCNRHAQDLDSSYQKNKKQQLKQQLEKESELRSKQDDEAQRKQNIHERELERQRQERAKVQKERQQMAAKKKLVVANTSSRLKAAIPKGTKSKEGKSKLSTAALLEEKGTTVATNKTTAAAASVPSRRKRASSVDNGPTSIAVDPTGTKKARKALERDSGGEHKGAARGSHFYRGEKDRYKQLDATAAVAVNKSQRPTLKHNRRNLADQKSVVKQDDVDKIVQDLMDHQTGVGGNENIKIMTTRKPYWKRQLAGLSTSDFDFQWKNARSAFLKQLNIGKSNASKKGEETITIPKEAQGEAGAQLAVVALKSSNRNAGEIELLDSNSDDDLVRGISSSRQKAIDDLGSKNPAATKPAASEQERGAAQWEAQKKKVGQRSTLHNSDSVDEMDEGDPIEGGARDDDSDNGGNHRGEEIHNEVPADRWSHLFLGTRYTGEEFKLDEWECVEDNSL